MAKLPTKESFEELKNELSEVKKEFKDFKKNSLPASTQQVDNSEQFLNTIVEKGVDVFETWTKGQIETNKYAIDKAHETEEKRFKIVDKLDKRTNLFKGIILIVTIICGVVLSIYDKLNEGVLAMLVFVIASMLTNNIKDLAKNIYKGFGGNNNDS